MTASQVKAWGSALLSNSYPCAFISWKYNTDYLSGTGIKSANFLTSVSRTSMPASFAS